MKRLSILLASATAIITAFQYPLAAQSNWDPYGQSPPSNPNPLPGYYQGQSSQNHDEDYSGKPNIQVETEFTQETQQRYQQMQEQHQKMIDTDRELMRKNYDPNESYYYGQSNQPQPPANPNSPVSPPYPKNQGSPYQQEMNQAESVMQGHQVSPTGEPMQGGVGRNPYLNANGTPLNSEVKTNYNDATQHK